MRKITVLGDGGWGTALAMTLLKNDHSVTLWGPFEDNIEAIRSTRKNRFLPGVDLPAELNARCGAGGSCFALAVHARNAQYVQGIFRSGTDGARERCKGN